MNWTTEVITCMYQIGYELAMAETWKKDALKKDKDWFHIWNDYLEFSSMLLHVWEIYA